MPSLFASLSSLLWLPQVFGHSFIIALDGANGVQSSGFGTRLTTRGQVHQYTGIITDKEINSSAVGPCGRIFGGDNFPPFIIEPSFELSRAEASGIPTVHEDGSITMGVFVHNPDGSGPFKCDFSSDASLHTFEPMNITRQIEGVDGVNPAANNYVYPLTAAFYPNATCTGGKEKNTCIIRCRNQLGFGSCAALRLGDAAKRFKPSNPSTPVPGPSNTSIPVQGHDKNVSARDPVAGNLTIIVSGTTNEKLHKDTESNLTAVANRADIETGGEQTNMSTGGPGGPDPAAFEIYKSEAQPNAQLDHPRPSTINQGTSNANGVPNGPPPHDSNYNPLLVPIPTSSGGMERRGLFARSRPRYLHKKPRRPRKHF